MANNSTHTHNTTHSPLRSFIHSNRVMCVAKRTCLRRQIVPNVSPCSDYTQFCVQRTLNNARAGLFRDDVKKKRKQQTARYVTRYNVYIREKRALNPIGESASKYMHNPIGETRNEDERGKAAMGEQTFSNTHTNTHTDLLD